MKVEATDSLTGMESSAASKSSSHPWLYEGELHPFVYTIPLVVCFILIALQMYDHGSLLQHLGIDQFWRMIDPDFPKGSLMLARQVTARALTVLAMIWALRGYMQSSNSSLRVNSKEVVVTFGIVDLTKEVITLDAIVSLAVNQSPPAAQWNWGTLSICTAAEQFDFHWLPEPMKVMEIINNARPNQ